MSSLYKFYFSLISGSQEVITESEAESSNQATTSSTTLNTIPYQDDLQFAVWFIRISILISLERKRNQSHV